jgi:hypothetical protein
MKTKIVIVLFCLLSVSVSLSAQKKWVNSYTTALGVKFYPGALSFKQYIPNKNAFEVNGYSWNKGGRLTVLYEINKPIAGIGGLSWYVGPGVHMSFYNTDHFNGSALMGLDGVLGLDLKIKNFPFDFSLDWQPSIDFGGGEDFEPYWGGFAIRYFIR